MKKLLTVLAAGLLVFGVAGMAKADFNNPGDLIQVVYQTTASGGSWEMATDLGSIASITANPTAFSDSFNLLTVSSALGGGFTSSSLSSLQVAYFAVTSTGAGQAWISGPSTGTVTSNGAAWNNVKTAMGNVINDYAGNTFPQGVTQFTGDTSSYYFQLDKNGLGIGSFDTFVANGLGEKALVLGGNVLQDIFAFNPANTSATVSGIFGLTTSLASNGEITINGAQITSATPIPPSVLLLGSGLLGLIGIRRRNLFNF